MVYIRYGRYVNFFVFLQAARRHSSERARARRKGEGGKREKGERGDVSGASFGLGEEMGDDFFEFWNAVV